MIREYTTPVSRYMDEIIMECKEYIMKKNIIWYN